MSTSAAVERAITGQTGEGPLADALRSLSKQAGGVPGPSLSNNNPANIGVTAPGGGLQASRDDHVHAHGNQAGGTLHPLVTPDPGGVAGFMSPADKQKLNGLPAAGSIPAGWPAYGEIFALMPGDNGATIGIATPIKFPQPPKALVGGVTVIDSGLGAAGPDSLVLPVAGVWRIFAQASIAEAGELVFATKVPAGPWVEEPSTAVARASGTSLFVLHSLLVIAVAGTAVQVRNPTGASAALTMTPATGPGTPAPLALSANLRAELMP